MARFLPEDDWKKANARYFRKRSPSKKKESLPKGCGPFLFLIVIAIVFIACFGGVCQSL